MRLHPMIVHLHIHDTTAAATRRRHPRFGWTALLSGAAPFAIILGYFALRALS